MINDDTMPFDSSADRIVLKDLTKIYNKQRVFSPSRFYNWLRVKFLIACGKLNEKVAQNWLNTKRNSNGFMAVNDLTFGVPKGECFGLLGVNGAGLLLIMKDTDVSKL